MYEEAKVNSVLREVFGFEKLRPYQDTTIRHILDNRKVLAVLPPGSGRSVCYHLPAHLLSGVTLVLSPSTSHIGNRTGVLKKRSKSTSIRVARNLDSVGTKEKVVFILPEDLEQRHNLEALRRIEIGQVVLEEAHCVSSLGHEFRPSYRKAVEIVRSLGEVPILALTSTVTPEVEKDLLGRIGEDTIVIREPLVPKNLRLHVFRVSTAAEKFAALEQCAKRIDGSGIVYAGTRGECERVHGFLEGMDVKAVVYNAGVRARWEEIRRGFSQGRWKVLVTTSLPSEDVGRPDVRFVVHFCVPGSPERYYQEICRAGRDGEISHCILLFDKGDIPLQEHLVAGNCPSREEARNLLRTLSFDQAKGIRKLVLETDMTTLQVRYLLAHLLERGVVEEINGYKENEYRRVAYGSPSRELDEFEALREKQMERLRRIIDYAETRECLRQFLSGYLGCSDVGSDCLCSNCKVYDYSLYLSPTENVERFLKEWRPALRPAEGIHSGGYCLDHYGSTEVGKTVREDKYSPKHRYRRWLVDFSKEVIQQKYPVGEIDLIVSVPTTKDEDIVGDLAKRTAEGLGIPYAKLLQKVRSTAQQKGIREKQKKQDNVKGAFELVGATDIKDKTLLLMDDVYDSGWTLRECAGKLCNAGAKNVYIFTLARTLHEDNL